MICKLVPSQEDWKTIIKKTKCCQTGKVNPAKLKQMKTRSLLCKQMHQIFFWNICFSWTKLPLFFPKEYADSKFHLNAIFIPWVTYPFTVEKIKFLRLRFWWIYMFWDLMNLKITFLAFGLCECASVCLCICVCMCLCLLSASLKN